MAGDQNISLALKAKHEPQTYTNSRGAAQEIQSSNNRAIK
jgi:hypothetical protein